MGQDSIIITVVPTSIHSIESKCDIPDVPVLKHHYHQSVLSRIFYTTTVNIKMEIS